MHFWKPETGDRKLTDAGSKVAEVPRAAGVACESQPPTPARHAEETQRMAFAGSKVVEVHL